MELVPSGPGAQAPGQFRMILRYKLQAPSTKRQAPRPAQAASCKRHEKDIIKMYKLVWLIGVLPGQAENTATQKEIL